MTKTHTTEEPLDSLLCPEIRKRLMACAGERNVETQYLAELLLEKGIEELETGRTKLEPA